MKVKKLMGAMKNLDQIFEGIVNTVIKPEHVEAIAKERWKFCAKCEFLDKIGTECAAPGTQPCCKECGCSLSFKTRSLSTSCPKGKWMAILSEEDELKLFQ